MKDGPGSATLPVGLHAELSLAEAAATPALRWLHNQAEQFVRAAKAPATLRAYRSDWEHFQGWCQQHTFCSLPASPETVALYLTALAATHRPSTMNRRLTAITKAHQIAGFPSPSTLQQPAVSETLKGIRRTLGTAPETKAPLLTADIRHMVQALPPNLAGHRDRALLLLGFAGGFRRSELAALDVDDVQSTEEGLVVKLRRSKTDAEGKGRSVGIPYGSTPSTCPVRALLAWKTAAGISAGALFRGVDRHGHIGYIRLHKDSVGLIVKRAAQAAGLDPDHYAGHSLRAGLATQAYLNGAGELAIMRQTGHRSLPMLRRYIRDSSLFRENPAAKLGL
jgi:site-specific recombinase XerD